MGRRLVEEGCSTITGSRRPLKNVKGGTWCMVTWDGLHVLCQGPKATGCLGRCVSDWQVAGNGAWWQPASPGEDTSEENT